MHVGVPSLWGPVVFHFSTGLQVNFTDGGMGRFHKKLTVGKLTVKLSCLFSVKWRAPKWEELSGSHLAPQNLSVNSKVTPFVGG